MANIPPQTTDFLRCFWLEGFGPLKDSWKVGHVGSIQNKKGEQKA